MDRPRIAKISDGLYIGNLAGALEPASELFEVYGIQTAVSVCGKDGHPDLPTVHVPIPDDRLPDDIMSSWIDTVVRVIRTSKAEHGKVLVFCAEGVNRSAAAIVAYLMSEGQSFEDARKAVIDGKWEPSWKTLTNEYFTGWLRNSFKA